MRKKPASGVLAGHCRLTISAASTSLPRFIQRGVNLRGSPYRRARAASAARGGWVKKDYASPLRHWALTDSRPSANVTLIILRIADLAAALARGTARLGALGWAGENDGLFAHPAWLFNVVSTSIS
jgi:hypothetical protein